MSSEALLKKQGEENMVCTQDDLLLVMQKLMDEKRKSRNLEEEILLLRKNKVVPILPEAITPTSDSSDQEGEVANLKKIIRDLAERLKVSLERNNEQPIELKDLEEELLLSQNETKTIKEKNSSLEEVIQKLKISLEQEKEQRRALEFAPKVLVDSANNGVNREKNERIQKLQQELFATQNDARAIKEKNSSLEDEIKRLQQFHLTLQTELKRESSRNIESEKTKGELFALSERFQGSERTLIAMTKLKEEYENKFLFCENELKKKEEELIELKRKEIVYEQEIKDLIQKLKEQERVYQIGESGLKQEFLQTKEELNNTKSTLIKVQEGRDNLKGQLEAQKSRIQDLESLKKEFESKSYEMAIERTNMISRFQETTAKLVEKEAELFKIAKEKELISEMQISLQKNYDKLKQDLINKEDELKISYDIVREEKKRSLQLEEEKKDIAHILEEREKIKLKLSEEITGVRAELKEQETQIVKYEKEFQEKTKKINELESSTSELKKHTELLEQHLARRVKECAHLTRSQEENALQLSDLQSRLQREKNKIQEFDTALSSSRQKEKELNDRLNEQFEIQRTSEAKWHKEVKNFQEIVNKQEVEFNDLKKIEGRYLIIQQLITQCSQVFSARKLPFELTQNATFFSVQPEIELPFIPKKEEVCEKIYRQETAAPFSLTREVISQDISDHSLVKEDLFQ